MNDQSDIYDFIHEPSEAQKRRWKERREYELGKLPHDTIEDPRNRHERRRAAAIKRKKEEK